VIPAHTLPEQRKPKKDPARCEGESSSQRGWSSPKRHVHVAMTHLRGIGKLGFVPRMSAHSGQAERSLVSVSDGRRKGQPRRNVRG